MTVSDHAGVNLTPKIMIYAQISFLLLDKITIMLHKYKATQLLPIQEWHIHMSTESRDGTDTQKSKYKKKITMILQI